MPNLKLKKKKFKQVMEAYQEDSQEEAESNSVFNNVNKNRSDLLKTSDSVNETLMLIHDYLKLEVTELFIKGNKTQKLHLRHSIPYAISSVSEFENNNLNFVGECSSKKEKIKITMPLDDLRSKRENLGKNIAHMGEMILVPIVSDGSSCAVLRVLLKKNKSLSSEEWKFLEYAAQQIVFIIEPKYKNEEMEKIASSLIDALSKKDNYTGGHTRRVGQFAEMIAKELRMSEREVFEVKLSAILHDIGKIGIDDNILKKKAPLTDEEFEIMKDHPKFGFEILKHMKSFNHIAEGIRYHHERPDGKGYPSGLKGKEIPLIASIVSVSDAFDALISNRPYRRGVSPEQAYRVIEDNKGTQFASEVVEAFENVYKKSSMYGREENKKVS